MSYKTAPRQGILSGSTLKLIAVISMLIDHVGAGILYYMIGFGKTFPGMTLEQTVSLYYLIRHIGRSAFPIYCFLLTEGFAHTKSRVKYAVNLALFAVLSEAFFDLALTARLYPDEFRPYDTLRFDVSNINTHQNVYCTLFLGLLTLWAMDVVSRLLQPDKNDSLRLLRIAFTVALDAAVIVAACCAADKLATDYRYWGILMIVLMYLLRFSPFLQSIVPFVALCLLPFLVMEYLEPTGRLGDVAGLWHSEVYALPAFVLMWLYNGKRGFLKGNTKYAFYLFYPAHLAIIYVLRTIIL